MVAWQLAAVLLTVSGVGDTVLLDFRSDSCGPCRTMDPIVDQMIAAGQPVRKVDIEQDNALANRFGIQAIPTFVMLVDGKEVDRIVGPASPDRLQQMLAMGSGRNQPRASSAPSQQFPATPTDQPLDRILAQPNSQADFSPERQEPAAPAADIQNPFVRATVRLKILDDEGHSWGSGTIIDARGGEVLILTCAHVFRDSQGKGPIYVDFFGQQAPRQLPGQLISFDLKTDVGLVSVKCDYAVTAARVAPRGQPLRAGDGVVSVGCNGGADPTVRQSNVTSLDKFSGPPNIQVAGQPVQGRSGGGLFALDGAVIGVCNAADPADNEGLFAGLASIHAELDRKGLTYVYQPNSALSHNRTILQTGALPSMADEMPLEQRIIDPAAAQTTAETGMSPAMLEQLQRQAGGAEMICIVRPLGDPNAKSEVIVLKNVSPELLRQLSADRAKQQE